MRSGRCTPSRPRCMGEAARGYCTCHEESRVIVGSHDSAPVPAFDIDEAEKRADGFRGRFRVMAYDSGDDLLEFVALDAYNCDESEIDGNDVDEIAQFACVDDETKRAIVDTLNAAPALIAEIRALRSKLAEAKRLGLEACALVHSAIDNAPAPTSNDPGDQSSIAAGHSVADRIAAALEAL